MGPIYLSTINESDYWWNTEKNNFEFNNETKRVKPNKDINGQKRHTVLLLSIRWCVLTKVDAEVDKMIYAWWTASSDVYGELRYIAYMDLFVWDVKSLQ